MWTYRVLYLLKPTGLEPFISADDLLHPLDTSSFIDDPLAVTGRQEATIEDGFVSRSKGSPLEEPILEDTIVSERQEKLDQIQLKYNVHLPAHDILSLKTHVVVASQQTSVFARDYDSKGPVEHYLQAKEELLLERERLLTLGMQVVKRTVKPMGGIELQFS